MAKFPKDAPKRRVVKALERLSFRLVREHVLPQMRGLSAKSSVRLDAEV